MSYTQLSAEERYVIYHLELVGLSRREIGRRLGRHHTTISREVARNGPTCGNVYWHRAAQEKALARRRIPRHWRRQRHGPLRDYVTRHLRQDWPPEAIAGRLRRDHPDDPAMRACSESIYRWVYRDAQAGGDLHTHLRWQRKKRRRQRRYGSGRRLIPGRVGIAERPVVVAGRSRFGDWEGDTVEGARGGGHLSTHVERKSRYLMVGRLSDKTAAVTARVATRAYRRLPRALRRTLTLDNGTEFSRFQAIERDTGLAVYFADPYAAWQRGANENTNGLLRRYLPKGIDLRTVSEAALAAVVKRLNHRPRKCLDYRTPHEVFSAARRAARQLR